MSIEEAMARKDAREAATRTWNEFERLADRLDELGHEFDDAECRGAFKTVEDLVMDLDDALHEAQEAVRDE